MCENASPWVYLPALALWVLVLRTVVGVGPGVYVGGVLFYSSEKRVKEDMSGSREKQRPVMRV